MIVVEFIGVFLLTSEIESLDMRLPTEVMYVFKQNKHVLSACSKMLPSFPSPPNSYDTEDFMVRHVSDIGFFGTILNPNRIVVGLYCKEYWKMTQTESGVKERRLKFKPRSKTHEKENKISESKSEHCIYWKKSERVESTPQDHSKAKIFLSNRNEYCQEDAECLPRDQDEDYVADLPSEGSSKIKSLG